MGDADLKAQGVSAEAETAQLELAPGRDAFLVLATDGLWDRLSSAEAVALVCDTVKQPEMCARVSTARARLGQGASAGHLAAGGRV